MRMLIIGMAVFAVASGSAGAATKADPDGRYKGKITADNVVDGGPIFFDVRKDGRRIARWRVTMNVTCASYPVRVELITQTMPTMKVRANGRFRTVYKGPVKNIDDVRIEVSGRLKGKRVVSGKIDYKVGFRSGTCTRTAKWTAKRAAKR